MKVILVFVAGLVALAGAQQQDGQYGLREFIQHLMELEKQQQRQVQEAPAQEVVFEAFEDDPEEVVYYRDPNSENFVGYNYDKVESPGKLSYSPFLTRPKRQAQSASSNPSTTGANNPNRLTTFINNLGALSTNIRRQTVNSIRNTLNGNVPNIFPFATPNAAPSPASASSSPTSLNDVYGSIIGARKNNRRRRSVDPVRQTYAAVIDFDAPVEMRSAVERSDNVPQAWN